MMTKTRGRVPSGMTRTTSAAIGGTHSAPGPRHNPPVFALLVPADDGLCHVTLPDTAQTLSWLAAQTGARFANVDIGAGRALLMSTNQSLPCNLRARKVAKHLTGATFHVHGPAVFTGLTARAAFDALVASSPTV